MDTRRFLQISAGVAAFLLGFEATVRVEDLVRYGTPILADARSQSDLITSDSLGIRGRPGGRFRQWVLDSLGFRGPEVGRTPPPGTIRVVTLGASETFGLLESPGKEFPRQLEDSLNARARRAYARCGAIPRYEVVNAALPGMYLPTAVRYVRGHLSSLAPDAILFYPTPHQYLDLRPPEATTGLPEPAPEAQAIRPFLPRSPSRVRDAVKELLPRPVSSALRRAEIASIVGRYPVGWEFAQVPPERVEALERDLRALTAATRQAGAIPILATHANRFSVDPLPPDPELMLMWRRYAPRATESTILAFEEAANEAIRRVGTDSGARVIAIDSALVVAGASGLFGDYIHFTDAGSALVASAAAPVVLAATLPSAGACPPDSSAAR